jgi:hypothetical protein
MIVQNVGQGMSFNRGDASTVLLPLWNVAEQISNFHAVGVISEGKKYALYSNSHINGLCF